LIHAPLPACGRARFDHRDFSLRRLADVKDGVRVAVCIPAHNEEATVGRVVAATTVLRDAGIVDDIVVVDDNSTDGTADAAEAAGGRVVRRDRPPGKGGALRRAVTSSDADVFVFLDADVSNVTPQFVLGLVGPLLTLPDVMLVKGAYRRSLYGRPGEGGRVTELVARPLLDRWFPDLADLSQPLAGETALRRAVTDAVAFDSGYAVEIGLLLDVAARFGAEAIAEVDLGERIHRNRPLEELRVESAAVIDAVLRRVGPRGPRP
jgi:glucosyl-3-phosphoglycerate synthase